MAATFVNEESVTGGLPSGIYFYKLQVYPANGGAGFPSTGSGQSFVETKKMILMK
ncbi:MAG: hypothetical protein IH795_00250 [Bacteroidetes bacterium]|nr:hypothetical protein [Bacteroidota bacterium]